MIVWIDLDKNGLKFILERILELFKQKCSITYNFWIPALRTEEDTALQAVNKEFNNVVFVFRQYDCIYF